MVGFSWWCAWCLNEICMRSQSGKRKLPWCFVAGSPALSVHINPPISCLSCPSTNHQWGPSINLPTNAFSGLQRRLKNQPEIAHSCLSACQRYFNQSHCSAVTLFSTTVFVWLSLTIADALLSIPTAVLVHCRFVPDLWTMPSKSSDLSFLPGVFNIWLWFSLWFMSTGILLPHTVQQRVTIRVHSMTWSKEKITQQV